MTTYDVGDPFGLAGDERYHELLSTLLDRAADGDLVAEALLAWGLYTGLRTERKSEVWSAYLEPGGDT